MKILITGAGGLIGRALVQHLSQAHEVTAVVRSIAAVSDSRVRTITADLSAPELPANLQPVDAVVHLAQSPHYREFPERADDIFNVNVGSTARLLDWSRRVGARHFVLASTGNVDSGVRSFYAASKQCAEQLAQCYGDAFAVLALRFHFVYGPGQRDSMLIPRLIANVRDGKPIQLAGHDGPRFNPTYINDAVEAIAMALERRVAGVVPIAGPQVLSVRQMVETIADQTGVAPVFTVDAAQAPNDLIGDITEMSARLAAPTWSFASGIGEMLR